MSQEALYREFGLLALDHSDEHASSVLDELLLVLREGLEPGTRLPREVKVVYAFKGHDRIVDIAAYHRQAGALSIGGVHAYGEGTLDPHDRMRVAAAFAHELGHAIVFARLTGLELSEIGRRFGHWSNVPTDEKAPSLLSKSLLEPHPLQGLMRLGSRSTDESRSFVQLSLWSMTNLTSEYAGTNLHEWFADAFAASVLHRLGEKGRLGPVWRPLLTRLPERAGGYWVNYNNLSPGFRRWLDRRFK